MKKSIKLDGVGFFEPITEHRKKLISEYRIPRRSIHCMDGYEIQRMAEANIAKTLINQLISKGAIKIEHHYDIADDSMVYIGRIDVLFSDDSEQYFCGGIRV